jgi:hypothetical protein|tara:strand:- start:915 stop:1304 length:390 start_codon:yes stop_codon:yes gene_type:complete
MELMKTTEKTMPQLITVNPNNNDHNEPQEFSSRERKLAKQQLKEFLDNGCLEAFISIIVDDGWDVCEYVGEVGEIVSCGVDGIRFAPINIQDKWEVFLDITDEMCREANPELREEEEEESEEESETVEL